MNPLSWSQFFPPYFFPLIFKLIRTPNAISPTEQSTRVQFLKQLMLGNGLFTSKTPQSTQKEVLKKQRNWSQGNWQKTILNLWSQQIFWRKKKCKNLFEFHLNPSNLQRVWKNILFLPGNSSSKRKDHSLQQWSHSQSHKLYISYIDSVLPSCFENVITARNSQCTNS